jgi:hypothetical protein
LINIACVVIFSDALVLTKKSETRKKAFWRYLDTGYYMSQWMTGPPPWENDTIFRLVNGYHLAAAKNLCSMTKCERHQAAIDVIATLPSEDRIDLNELDKVRLTNISPCSVWLLLTMLFPLFRCCFQM